MASLLKPWITRYRDSNGRQVPKGTPGARKVKERGRKWYGQFVDGDGKRQRVPLCTDKAAARQMLAQLERNVALGKAGLLDPFEAHMSAPIETHLAAYHTDLRSNKGVSAEYLKKHFRRLRAVLKHGKVNALRDIRADAVEQFLQMLAERGTGTSMRNHYLSSAKGFVRWCVEKDRIGRDVLIKLKRAGGELRRVRRALSEDELVRLLRAARERPMVEMTTIRSGTNKGQRTDGPRRPETRARAERRGWERSLIYKCLALTGLRRGELEALEVRHLTLSGPRPHLLLPGTATKNGEDADIPLRSDLAEDLRQWIEATGKTGGDRVLCVIKDLYKVLRADLKLAGVTYKDHLGRTVDVHALRHTCATHLSRAKVAPKIAQKFMRHSDVRLTLETYTDTSLLDEAEALAALPNLPLLPRTDASEGRVASE